MNLLLVDASAFIFRAYYALPQLTRRRDGRPVGAVAGFSDMLWRALRYGVHKDVPALPSHIGIVFDHPSKGFRSEIFPAYKATRPERPEDLLGQFALVRAATRAFGFHCIEQRGWEADDLIATYTAEALQADGSVVIVSADKDLMQLVCDGAVMVDTMRDQIIDAKHVRKKFGVDPCQMVDYQALVGDPTDNVPGVPAVGAKTAARLLREFGFIDVMLANLARVQPPRIRDQIKASTKDIEVSRELVTLRNDVTLDVPLSDLEYTGDLRCGPILEFCDEMEFISLAAKINKALQTA